MDLISTLTILAILLAILALIPYCLEIWFYCRKKPRFKIQIANKKISKRGKETIFDFWLGIQPKNVSLILKKVFLSFPAISFKLEKYPGFTRDVGISLNPLEGTGFGPTLILDNEGNSYNSKSGIIYTVRIVLEENIDPIKTTLTIESEIDYLKLGFWFIFYRSREYRSQKKINVKLDEFRQELII